MAARYLYAVEAIEFGAPGSATVHFSSKKWKGRQMLKELSVDQAKFVAILAKAARAERDAFLGKVAEKDIDGIQAARGEHNPIAQLGFEQLPPGAPQPRPLREAIVTLSPRARAELYALTYRARTIGGPEVAPWPDRSGGTRGRDGDTRSTRRP